MIKEISDIIHKNGALCGVHCCGECRWDIPISAGVDIINPDVYTYPENFFEYSKNIGKFLKMAAKLLGELCLQRFSSVKRSYGSKSC